MNVGLRIVDFGLHQIKMGINSQSPIRNPQLLF